MSANPHSSQAPGNKRSPVSFKFQRLHARIFADIRQDIPNLWHNHRGTGRWIEGHSTHVMGTFRCVTKRWRNRRWTSGHVAIHIRGYENNGYDAVVFNQRCDNCKQLGIFTLDDDTYVQRIVYRVKKWAGLDPGHAPYDDKHGPPHRKDLCEGCKAGYCTKA